jgi:hypothetical protein
MIRCSTVPASLFSANVLFCLLLSCCGGRSGETDADAVDLADQADGLDPDAPEPDANEDPLPDPADPVDDPDGADDPPADEIPGDAAEEEPVCTDCWRSALYPEDWTPLWTDPGGRFLHDFSYAGYRNGELPLPDPAPGPEFNAADYGADPTGEVDSTAAIQQAVDAAAAAGGGVAVVPAGLYRCDGVLQVHSPGIVIRGAGPSATLIYFTLSSGMSNQSHITFEGSVSQGPDLALAADGTNRSDEVLVDDASSLSAGDDIAVGWVITDEFVAEHGMTGTWVVFNGQWKPFFRRRVEALDLTSTPNRVTLDVPLRYEAKTRDLASLRLESGYISECGLESLSLSNAVTRADAWSQNQVHAAAMENVKDCWIRDVHTFDSPFGPTDHHLQSSGIMISASKRVTVAGCRMEKAQNRGGGGNGYLFEIRTSSEVLMRDCAGIDGRHNFIQNWDFGATGCVFLRCESSGSRTFGGDWDPVGLPGFCEYHHSLATANLVDGCVLYDGWYGGNRLDESSGAGHTTTQSVFWNVSGGGTVISMQYGWGYVIGPGDMTVTTSLALPNAAGTAPEDWVERAPAPGPLVPASLYEDQLLRRLGP